jgi:hypothetical protein
MPASKVYIPIGQTKLVNVARDEKKSKQVLVKNPLMISPNALAKVK